MRKFKRAVLQPLPHKHRRTLARATWTTRSSARRVGRIASPGPSAPRLRSPSTTRSEASGTLARRTLEPRAVFHKDGHWYLAAWNVARARSTSTGSTGSRRSRWAPASSGSTRGPRSTGSGRATSTSSRGASATSRSGSPARAPPSPEEQWPERFTPRRRCSVTVRARLSPGNYLLGWVLGYGGQAEVAGPPDIRDQLRARVAESRPCTPARESETRCACTSSTGPSSFSGPTSRSAPPGCRPRGATSRPPWGSPSRCARCSATRTRRSRTSRWPSTTPSARSATTSSPATRPRRACPRSSLAQFDAAEEAARALGVTVWSMREFEADDALATAATRFRDQVEQVRILTPDKDLGQCLSGRRVVQVDRIRGREIDEEALRARRGIGPESIPDFLALVGDTADGIPGLPGFGEKSAAALLARHVHLETIPDDPALWPAGIRGAASKAGVALLRARGRPALPAARPRWCTTCPWRSRSRNCAGGGESLSSPCTAPVQRRSPVSRHRACGGAGAAITIPGHALGLLPLPPCRPRRRLRRGGGGGRGRHGRRASGPPPRLRFPPPRAGSRGPPGARRERHPGALLVGCSGSGVIGDAREAEEGPALSLTGAWLPGVACNGFHVEMASLPTRTPARPPGTSWPASARAPAPSSSC